MVPMIPRQNQMVWSILLGQCLPHLIQDSSLQILHRPPILLGVALGFAPQVAQGPLEAYNSPQPYLVEP